jgi:hypothetical protein
MAAWPRVGTILGILFLIHRYTQRNFKQKLELSHHDSDLSQVPPGRARQLQAEVTDGAQVSFAQADVFARVIVETSEIQKRIIEQYRPGRRTLRQEVTVDIDIPQSALRRIETADSDDNGSGPASQNPESSTFYFPVVVPPKGVLFDDLKVYSANDGELPTLAYREYVKVASSVLHLLLAAACYTRPDDLPSGARECEVGAIEGLISRIDPRPRKHSAETHIPKAGHRFRPRKRANAGPAAGMPTGTAAPPTASRVPDGASLSKAIRGLAEVSDEDPSCAQAIRLAANLVRVLSSHYAIVVEIPATASGRFTLRYECTLIPELDLESGREHAPNAEPGGGLAGRLRSWGAMLGTLLGTRPVNIKISLDNAWACQSYHVIVSCAESLYVSSQVLSLPGPDYLKRFAKHAPTPPHIRFRRRLGQSYAHFYARYLPEPRTRIATDEHGVVKVKNDGKPDVHREKAPKLILNFAEVPPGSLCRAALAAIAAAALVWIIGYSLAHLHDGVLSTDVPVLILAFPGVAASWLGFDSSTPDLFQGPLTARLSLACTTLISLLATMLYVEPTTAPGRSTGHEHAPGAGVHLTVLGIADWRWWTLVILAIFNASYLGYRWFLNAWRFRYLASRPDPAGLSVKAYEDEDEDEPHDSPTATATSSSPPFSAVVPGITANES